MFSVLSLAAVAASVSAEPPRSPNVCTRTLCVEVLATLHPPKRGFLQPEVRTFDEGEGSILELSFEELGTLTIRDVLLGAGDKPSAGMTAVLSCKTVRPCRTITLAVVGATSEQAGEQLKCQVATVWTLAQDKYYIVKGMVAAPYENVIELGIGTSGKCESLRQTAAERHRY